MLVITGVALVGVHLLLHVLRSLLLVVVMGGLVVGMVVWLLLLMVFRRLLVGSRAPVRLLCMHGLVCTLPLPPCMLLLLRMLWL